MRIKLDLPQEIAEALETEGRDLSRTALEALALEGFRSGKLSESQVRRLLDFRTRYEVDAFLRAWRPDALYLTETIGAKVRDGGLRSDSDPNHDWSVKGGNSFARALFLCLVRGICG